MRITGVSFEQPTLVASLLTTAEAAPLLKVTRATVVRWIHEGHARPVRKMAGPNGSYLFELTEIERLRETPRPRKSGSGCYDRFNGRQRRSA